MSLASTILKSPSLAGSDREHWQNPTSSPARGALSDSVLAAPGHVHPRLDEHERRALRTLSMTSEPHKRRDTSPARALRIPCPLPDFSLTERRGVITNDLDVEQRRQLEVARTVTLMHAQPRSVIDSRVEYGFRPARSAVEAKSAVTLSLRVHIIGPPARTDDQLAKRKALRARFLVPQELPLDVLLAPCESTSDDEVLFKRWAQRHQELSSLSVSATARAQGHYLSSAHDPSTSLAIAGASGDAGHPDFSDQKRLRRLGNLAKVTPQTPTIFRSRDIPATLPDIRFDPGNDVVSLDVPRDSGCHRSHREESVAGSDDRDGRRPVTRDALRSLEDEVIRDRSSAERHAVVVRQLPHLEDYRALSERLLAVEQANASLHATVERLAPLEMEIVALRAQNQLLIQLLGGRGPVGSAPASTLPHHVKHRVGAHPFWESDERWTKLRPEDSRGCMCRQIF
ncbi:hypothetical protein Plhal304r1_c090g0171411 [Plasmopara halstedii]